jgi:hypothetical protein
MAMHVIARECLVHIAVLGFLVGKMEGNDRLCLSLPADS